MADSIKIGALSMRAVLLTIAQGTDAQRFAGNGFSTRADKAVAAGLARHMRGQPGLYQLTESGAAQIGTGGSER